MGGRSNLFINISILVLHFSKSILSCIYSSSRGEFSDASSEQGSKLRHWPPGTNRNVRAVFFCLRARLLIFFAKTEFAS